MAKRETNATVTLGDGVITIKRQGSSRPVVANILGMDTDGEGRPVKIWLDRLVHLPKESFLGDWRISGAVSTVLAAAP